MAELTRDEAIALVTKERATLIEATASCSRENYSAWLRKRDEATAAAIARLAASGAFIRVDWHGTILNFDGIRATCTGGLCGALSNWLARATKESAR